MKVRLQGWLDSDLVGIAATLYGFVLLVLAFIVFRVGGGIGGMIVIVVSWIPMLLFAIKGWGRPLLDHEANWESATEVAARVREEIGLPVTTIDSSARPEG